MKLILRGLHQRESDAGVWRRDGDPATIFLEALNVRDHAPADVLLTWDDIDAACALDVDVGGRRFDPTAFHLVNWLDAPEYFWVSHGGGFRGIFCANDILTARERASLFAFFYIDGWSPFNGVEVQRVEFKHETRHPAYVRTRDGGKCSRVHRGDVKDFNRAIKALTGDDFSVSEEQITEWLQSRGMERGKRYDHSQCPIAPSDKGHESPVIPLEAGVWCHVCEANGPYGFASYVSLIDPSKRHRRRNPVKLCVGGPAHWEHTSHVFSATLGETGKQAELLYRALLKARWCKSDDSEKRRTGVLKWIDSVFFPPPGIVRGIGQWFLPDLMTPRSAGGLARQLKSLPACRRVDDDGKSYIIDSILGKLEGNGDIADCGYPSLVPVRSPDFAWGGLLDVESERPEEEWLKVRVTTPTNPPFEVRPAAELQAAEDRITRCFPGVNLNLLRFLVACKGVVQNGPPAPPLLMVWGVSEASKTAHVLLAAELCCDRVTVTNLGLNADEFLRGIAQAANAGNYALLDEIGKNKALPDLRPRLLSLVRNTSYRALHVGFLPMPSLPAIIMADTYVPEMMREAQLARRIVEVPLGSGIAGAGVDWRDTCGTGDIVGWRAASKVNTQAADAFTSDVMRNYADKNFHVIAERLGFQTFRDSKDKDVDVYADHVAFFVAVCQAPDAQSNFAKGRGYKLIDPRRETSLERAYQALVEGDSDQAITGAQWPIILGVPGVECDFRPKNAKRFVRFRLGVARSAMMKVNGEIHAACLKPGQTEDKPGDKLSTLSPESFVETVFPSFVPTQNV